jgi:hypothetical protein
MSERDEMQRQEDEARWTQVEQKLAQWSERVEERVHDLTQTVRREQTQERERTR